MRNNTSWIIASLILMLKSASVTIAVPVTVPSDLSPGDQYRLVFVTDGTRDATSSNIGDYNSFVTDAAIAVTELNALGISWTAIASTSSTDARNNTGTNPEISAGVPIYGLNDKRIVDDNADLWDGTLDTGIRISETGFDYGDAGLLTRVWTGTRNDGTADPVYYLGAWAARYGKAGSTQYHFIGTDIDGTEDTKIHHLYAISGILTVVTPETGSTLVLLGAAVPVLMLLRRKVVSRSSTRL